jgi:hypothetical protein
MKLMFATLSMVAMFALSTGGSTPAASAAPTSPSIGACRWFCGAGSQPFKTEAACDAVCSTECEAVC